MNLIHQRPLIGILCLMIALLAISACSDKASEANDSLPTQIPSTTPRPHATSTPVAVAMLPEPVQVDWSKTDQFASAMRPEFVGDIQQGSSRRHYIEATFEMTPLASIVNGVQRVYYTNTSPDTLNEIVFRLAPNTPSVGWRLAVSDVMVNGQPVPPNYELSDSVMQIPLAQPLAPGEGVELFMRFNLVAERGLSNGIFANANNIFASTLWYPALSVYEAGTGWWKGLFAGDPFYNEMGLFEIKLTHADNMNIVISGVTVDTQPSADSTVTDHIVSGPMRDIALFASPIIGKISGQTDGTTINVYYLPEGERAAEYALQSTQRALEIENRIFGEYPYAELDVLEIDLRGQAAGVEYSGVITASENDWLNGNPSLEITLAHEVGHQYWYGLVGNNAIEETWLDEALASYTEYVYLREAYPDDRQRVSDIIDFDRGAYNFFRSNGGDFPLITIDWATCPQLNNCLIPYTKGPLFYTGLEEMLGQEMVYQALQTYVAEMKYKLATTADLLRVFEQVAGQDLDEYFYRWIGDFPSLDPAAKAAVDRENAN
ncbi:MAG: M1 family metallopeptidase [Chloroflexi bacterium]|nr:M1 family metallopeptidase [Chloroflexota bacterium]